MPLPAQHAHLAGLRARLELELDRAVERLDRDGRAERRLHDREVDLREDVVALAHEALVGPDAHRDVDVARAAAERAGVALAGEADALAVVDAGRDSTSSVRSSSVRPAPSHVSHGCSILRPVPLALGARRRADELAEDAARDLLQPAGAAAALAGRDVRAGLHAVAVARGAGDRDLELDRRPSCRARPRRGRSRSPPGRRRRARPPAPRCRTGRRRRRPRRGRRDCRGRSGSAEAARAEAGVAVAVVELPRLRRSRAPRTPRRPRGSARSASGSLETSGCSSRASARNAFLISRSSASRGDAEQLVVVAFGGGHRAHIVPAAVGVRGPSRAGYSAS